MEEGTQVGAYRLLRLIGEGGMGTVWLAEHEMLGRRAAIKVLHRHLSNEPSIVQRFFNEARAATRIADPGIVQVFDFGMNSDGNAFIAMELLVGEPLEDRIRSKGRFQVAEALRIMRQVASTVGAGHLAGVIHRDLKPSNIYIVNDPEVPGGERAKVLDFGIAKIEPGARSHNVTMENAVMGTPHYMSPEQCRDARKVTPSSDVYAIGCMLFQLVVGRLPFTSDGGFGELITMIIMAAPPSPSSLVPGLPRALDQLVQRCLAKDPLERFGNGVELATALGTLIGSAEASPKRDGATLLGDLVGGVKAAINTITLLRSNALDSTASRTQLVEAAVPVFMRGDTYPIASFVRACFGGARPISTHVLELERPELSGADAHDFYCIFVSSGPKRPDGFATQVFFEEAKPLELHLRGLTSDRSKVVVAVLDTPELPRGARKLVLRYRRELKTMVLLTYVGELRRLSSDEQRRRFFSQRLEQASLRRSPFAQNDALVRPADFVSTWRSVSYLVGAVERHDSIVVVSGIPGSGKTSLVNMAILELEPTSLVRINCAATRTNVIDFCYQVAAEVGLISEPLPIRKLVRAIAHNFSLKAESRKEKALLLFEDADWLITLASGQGDPSEVEAARGFWIELAELAASGSMGVVITTVRGFAIQSRRIEGWENPVARHLISIPLMGIGLDGVEKMAGDLAADVGMTICAQATERIYRWSGGYIGLTLRICDQILNEIKAEPLVHYVVQASDVDHACKALVIAGKTFADSLIPWLNADERAVLLAVARDRPKSVMRLRRALVGEIDEGSVGAALEHLRELGLIAFTKGRETVTIRLLSEWVQIHGTSQPLVQRRKTDKRLSVAATVTAALLLVIGVYSVWLRERIITTEHFSHGQCTYRFKYPERVAQGDTSTVYVFRECKSATKTELVLSEQDATVATIAPRPLKFDRRGSLSERANVSIEFIQPDASGDYYRFGLEEEVASATPVSLGHFAVVRDVIPGLRGTLELAAKVAMGALSLALLIVTLQRRVLDFFRGFAGNNSVVAEPIGSHAKDATPSQANTAPRS